MLASIIFCIIYNTIMYGLFDRTNFIYYAANELLSIIVEYFFSLVAHRGYRPYESLIFGSAVKFIE